MAERRRGSIRLWQTEMFIAVIVVAMLILLGSLSSGVRDTLAQLAETSELRNASALAQRLEREFPLGVSGLASVKETVAEYRDIYGGGIWVYDADGNLLDSAYDTAPTDAVLESARLGALDERTSYAASDLRANGWVTAGKSLRAADGTLEGVVVTASAVDQAVAILNSVRNRLWVTFWISLVVAGLLGFAFSTLISRRITALSGAAAAIAGGDFDQRLSAGWVPDEVTDLAASYNSMAEKLGEAFSAIEESRRQIAAVVESMAEGVLAFDADGAVLIANPEALRLVCTEHERTTCSSLDDIGDEPAVIELVRRALAGESGAETVELGPCWVVLHATPLLGEDGSAEGAVLLLADVTEQHRIEDAQRRFVADASHEMRTPIAALKGMLELLADGAKEVPEVRDEFIDTMQAEADRLSRLVIDLLTLAQLDAGSLRLKLAPAHAADLLGDVARIMATLAEKQGVELSVEVEGEDLRLLGDRDRVVQVLVSFTDNALKHSEPGSRIHLRARPEGADGVRLEVADEGSGIGAEELARVFERFYRADQARAGGGGTGLGLAIAKEIVEAHGSAIDVESQPGVGTTFGFTLPLA